MEKKIKRKYAESFNGETGCVFTITFDRLKRMLEIGNKFRVEGFTVTKRGVDVFVDTGMAANEPIKIKGDVL